MCLQAEKRGVFNDCPKVDVLTAGSCRSSGDLMF